MASTGSAREAFGLRVFAAAEPALAICRLDPRAPLPDWFTSAAGFTSATRTSSELSLVCVAAVVPPDVPAVRGFGVLTLEGPLPFTAVGIIARLTAVLSSAAVSVLPIATFDTDHVLVPLVGFDGAVAALRAAGYLVEDA